MIIRINTSLDTWKERARTKGSSLTYLKGATSLGTARRAIPYPCTLLAFMRAQSVLYRGETVLWPKWGCLGGKIMRHTIRECQNEASWMDDGELEHSPSALDAIWPRTRIFSDRQPGSNTEATARRVSAGAAPRFLVSPATTQPSLDSFTLHSCFQKSSQVLWRSSTCLTWSLRLLPVPASLWFFMIIYLNFDNTELCNRPLPLDSPTRSFWRSASVSISPCALSRRIRAGGDVFSEHWTFWDVESKNECMFLWISRKFSWKIIEKTAQEANTGSR